MAFKHQGTTAGYTTKFYFWRMADFGNGVSLFGYVSADTVAVIAMYDYFTQGGDTELSGPNHAVGGVEGASTPGGIAKRGIMAPGDLLWVWQVAAIDDTRTIQQDIAAGLADVSLHTVLNSLQGTVNISEDLLTATVTYTS